ncbi:hypothetical protein [Enterobacter hormaechei]|uniref:hypothetical protein n=1 Tax=Enterobacter hormaechei TaxID=158836 RepID=UPI003EBA1086
MAGADFLLSMSVGAALSWASYSIVAHVVSKQHVSTLRAIVWGALGTLSLVLGICAFSAVGAEHQAARKDIVCADDNPECYARTHHNPVRECKQLMDEKAKFHHVWLDSEAQPVFSTYLWHNENKRTIQMFGQQAKANNSLGMHTPLQYFCVFNANTGKVIAASFE